VQIPALMEALRGSVYGYAGIGRRRGWVGPFGGLRGCFPTACLLPLLTLFCLGQGLIETKGIIIRMPKTGCSGGRGRAARKSYCW